MATLAHALAQSQRGRQSTRGLLRMPDPTRDAEHASDLAAAMNDAVSLFRELKIGYALIGGLAAMVHGQTRYTEDVDFVAEPDHADILEAHPRRDAPPRLRPRLYLEALPPLRDRHRLVE
ncbi:MAG: hypothetical protein AAF663_13150 [Planctomycetota bacterium]